MSRHHPKTLCSHEISLFLKGNWPPSKSLRRQSMSERNIHLPDYLVPRPILTFMPRAGPQNAKYTCVGTGHVDSLTSALAPRGRSLAGITGRPE